MLRAGAPGIALPAGLGRYARLETASVLIITVVLRGSPVAMLLLGATTLQVGYGAIATGVAAAGAGVVLSLVVVSLPRLADLARSAPARAEHEARRSALPVSTVAAVLGIPAALVAGPAIDSRSVRSSRARATRSRWRSASRRWRLRSASRASLRRCACDPS